MSSTIFDSTVIPFDGTDAAPSAAESIAPLLDGKQVTFVMVLDQYVENALAPFAEAEGLTIAQAAEAAGDRAIAQANAAGMNASYEIVNDSDVIDGVLSVASGNDATSIVLPTHSMGGVTRWLTGNLRDKMVSAANLPILVMPGK